MFTNCRLLLPLMCAVNLFPHRRETHENVNTWNERSCRLNSLQWSVTFSTVMMSGLVNVHSFHCQAEEMLPLKQLVFVGQADLPIRYFATDLQGVLSYCRSDDWKAPPIFHVILNRFFNVFQRYPDRFHCHETLLATSTQESFPDSKIFLVHFRVFLDLLGLLSQTSFYTFQLFPQSLPAAAKT